jgi:MinD superfamily P-loop ATPase
MAMKTVKDAKKIAEEMKKLKMPANVNIFQINKDISEVFKNASARGVQVLIEIHYDDTTKNLTEIKSRLGNNTITQWP